MYYNDTSQYYVTSAVLQLLEALSELLLLLCGEDLSASLHEVKDSATSAIVQGLGANRGLPPVAGPGKHLDFFRPIVFKQIKLRGRCLLTRGGSVASAADASEVACNTSCLEHVVSMWCAQSLAKLNALSAVAYCGLRLSLGAFCFMSESQLGQMTASSRSGRETLAN